MFWTVQSVAIGAKAAVPSARPPTTRKAYEAMPVSRLPASSQSVPSRRLARTTRPADPQPGRVASRSTIGDRLVLTTSHGTPPSLTICAAHRVRAPPAADLAAATARASVVQAAPSRLNDVVRPCGTSAVEGRSQALDGPHVLALVV